MFQVWAQLQNFVPVPSLQLSPSSAHMRVHTHSLSLTKNHIYTRTSGKKERHPLSSIPDLRGKKQMAKVALLPAFPGLLLALLTLQHIQLQVGGHYQPRSISHSLWMCAEGAN